MDSHMISMHFFTKLSKKNVPQNVQILKNSNVYNFVYAGPEKKVKPAKKGMQQILFMDNIFQCCCCFFGNKNSHKVHKHS